MNRILHLLAAFSALLMLRPAVAQGDNAIPADTSSLVFVEGMDTSGTRISLGTGVMVKKGYVLVNYHYVAGMTEVVVYRPGMEKKYFSDGYLDVDAENDLILISVPSLDLPLASIYENDSVPSGEPVLLVQDPGLRKINLMEGTSRGRKEINSVLHNEYTARSLDECTGGPVFYKGKVAGFVTAGYLDNRWFAYAVPANLALPLLRRSFIIKDYSFLSTAKPGASIFQEKLMETLHSIVWLNFEDAVRQAAKKNKKIIVDVYTSWCGWCKVMDTKSFSRKSIISYINENYYAVRLDAETNDSIWFQGRLLQFLTEQRVHELAWLLLRGNMSYPALVFMDEKGKIITVVSGYLNPGKLEAALHFFRENQYLKPGANFLQFEQDFLRKRAEESVGGTED